MFGPNLIENEAKRNVWAGSDWTRRRRKSLWPGSAGRIHALELSPATRTSAPSHGGVGAPRLEEQLALAQPPHQLGEQQLLLLLDLLQDALVLLRAPREIGQHLGDRPVRDVLVRRVAGLACNGTRPRLGRLALAALGAGTSDVLVMELDFAETFHGTFQPVAKFFSWYP